MRIEVFVENEAHCNIKNSFDEKSLEYRGSQKVALPYPFPYGFLLNTTSLDGDNVDCYILTDQFIKRGQIVACEPVGMLEQLEDGKVDHNILACLRGESAEVSDSVKRILTDFISHIFDHIENKSVEIGAFLGKREAIAYIEQCRDV
jgi:inorganic pyrophosphatase